MGSRVGNSCTILSARDEPVTFRPSLPADEPFLFRLYASTRTEELAILPWNDEQKTAFLWHQFASQHLYYHQVFPDAQFSVLQCQGEDIGRLYLSRDRDEIKIIDVALLPAWRNRGIGSALLKLVLSDADSSGKRVSIHVEKNNPALRLYLRHGFREARDNGVYFMLEWSRDFARSNQ